MLMLYYRMEAECAGLELLEAGDFVFPVPQPCARKIGFSLA